MNRFDKIAKQWDAAPRRLKLAGNTYTAINDIVNLHSDLKILDIGTGTGLLLMHFITKVKHITGIDNSQGMLDMLNEKAKNAGVSNISTFLFNDCL